MGAARTSRKRHYKGDGPPDVLGVHRYANLKDGDIQVLVGRKTTPLPIVTYQEFLGVKVENVAKTWQAA